MDQISHPNVPIFLLSRQKFVHTVEKSSTEPSIWMFFMPKLMFQKLPPIFWVITTVKRHIHALKNG